MYSGSCIQAASAATSGASAARPTGASHGIVPSSSPGRRDHSDAVPVLVTSLDRLAEDGPMAPIRWRYGRTGLHSLTGALDNPEERTAYGQRQADRAAEADRRHRRFPKTLACTDCHAVPKQEKVRITDARVDWTHRKGGTRHPCHAQRKADAAHRKDQERLQAARPFPATGWQPVTRSG
ncbi:hypothetical protein [Kitasatospora sp. GP82]|uniref:hypothetical protein n=1 Tax=Kitasatospora sp. GP82 TaxID=3035089 RepID=UPI00247721B0|nr:hypothetical protein [Kitasatospora sp. GP82]MDH6130224.1 hypothetical protein [Kitasatospora sp. GP82]